MGFGGPLQLHESPVLSTSSSGSVASKVWHVPPGRQVVTGARGSDTGAQPCCSLLCDPGQVTPLSEPRFPFTKYVVGGCDD